MLKDNFLSPEHLYYLHTTYNASIPNTFINLDKILHHKSAFKITEKSDIYKVPSIVEFILQNPPATWGRSTQQEFSSALRIIQEKCNQTDIRQRPTIEELIVLYEKVFNLFNL